MLDTRQKTNQLKNVAVAIIRDEEGNVLLVKPSEPQDNGRDHTEWDFPANVIIPGATYTETFVAEVLEISGCIVEAVSLVSSEKLQTISCHYEYVECKVVCRDNKFKKKNNGEYRWVPPSKVRNMIKKRLNRDISSFLGI